MDDKIHPNDSPNSSGEMSTKPLGVSSSKNPRPPSGTYVIELPKDQIYRYPPPENTRKFQEYAVQKRSRRRSCFRRCFFWTIGFLTLIILLLVVTASVLYLIFRPESPSYSVDNVAIRGMNLTSSSRISPIFNITIRAVNPNGKIGIYYEKGSTVDVYSISSGYYSYLGEGVLPAFYQPSKNLTVFQTVLKGSNIVLTSAVKSDLKAASKNGSVPLRINVRTPVRIKISAVKMWTITLKVKCDVMVDNLTANSKIISKVCKYRVKLI
ncbi:NDR1/HIN1-like protein 13 [Impatiens glandulifera]|uniref:NDR1/HIN1-like protein 13 n=1 Tax=Impatiens glandulifera TaxID=253017 RepID=UPI001FB151A2|nr:NDR1/HIN1-like protein 13 [Impatiens glandulifera]